MRHQLTTAQRSHFGVLRVKLRQVGHAPRQLVGADGRAVFVLPLLGLVTGALCAEAAVGCRKMNLK
jgi:hypothetical protein